MSKPYNFQAIEEVLAKLPRELKERIGYILGRFGSAEHVKPRWYIPFHDIVILNEDGTEVEIPFVSGDTPDDALLNFLRLIDGKVVCIKREIEKDPVIEIEKTALPIGDLFQE